MLGSMTIATTTMICRCHDRTFTGQFKKVDVPLVRDAASSSANATRPIFLARVLFQPTTAKLKHYGPIIVSLP
jgi:hypothetical protein